MRCTAASAIAGRGWERGFLRYPLTDETATPAPPGRYNHFQGGSIYWTPATDSHEVHGAIRAKWASLGWERSFLGYPTTDESTTPDGVGRYNHFQGGSIYWTPATGAREVHGAIRARWSGIGWERSFLGYPLTDETTTPDGVGRYNHFQGGSIYWTPTTGAHEVHGAIRNLWASMGWERSFLGYPTSDELSTEDGIGRYSEFQRGSIYWSVATGALACRETVRLHVKVLTAPTRFSINQMIANMRLTFATAQVGIKYVSFESLSLPALNDLDVGECRWAPSRPSRPACTPTATAPGPTTWSTISCAVPSPHSTDAPVIPPDDPAPPSRAAPVPGRWRTKWATC